MKKKKKEDDEVRLEFVRTERPVELKMEVEEIDTKPFVIPERDEKGLRIRAVGYIRVSTSKQVERGLSLDDQEKECRKVAEYHGWEYLRTIRDEGVSSREGLDRPGIQEVLRLIDSGEINILIVTEQDRLSKEPKEWWFLKDVFKERGIQVYTKHGRVDLETLEGELFNQIKTMIDWYQRELTRRKILSVLSMKKRNGEHLGPVPFGFKREGKFLVEDGFAMALIQKIKRMRRDGKSLREIGKRMKVSHNLVRKIAGMDLRVLKRKYLGKRVESGENLRSDQEEVASKI